MKYLFVPAAIFTTILAAPSLIVMIFSLKYYKQQEPLLLRIAFWLTCPFFIFLLVSGFLWSIYGFRMDHAAECYLLKKK